MALDFERARFNMVEQQVRTWEVLDQRVLDTLRQVKREDFVAPKHRKMAFADLALPIDGSTGNEPSETMMKPVVEGRLLQALEIGAGHSVLEIGTGSGFVTACLAHLGREVVSIDRNPAFVERARARLANAGVANVKLDVADAMTGYAPGRTFDRIAVTGAVYSLPDAFKSWLAVGGRLFVVRGVSPAMDGIVVTRRTETEFDEQTLFETDLPYLVNAAPPKRFVL